MTSVNNYRYLCSVFGGPNTTWMLLQQPCRASLSEPHCIRPLVAMAHPKPLARSVRDAIHQQCERSSAPLLLRNQACSRPSDSEDSSGLRYPAEPNVPDHIPRPFPLSIDAHHAASDSVVIRNALNLSSSMSTTQHLLI